MPHSLPSREASPGDAGWGRVAGPTRKPARDCEQEGQKKGGLAGGPICGLMAEALGKQGQRTQKGPAVNSQKSQGVYLVRWGYSRKKANGISIFSSFILL